MDIQFFDRVVLDVRGTMKGEKKVKATGFFFLLFPMQVNCEGQRKSIHCFFKWYCPPILHPLKLECPPTGSDCKHCVSLWAKGGRPCFICIYQRLICSLNPLNQVDERPCYQVMLIGSCCPPYVRRTKHVHGSVPASAFCFHFAQSVHRINPFLWQKVKKSCNCKNNFI